MLKNFGIFLAALAHCLISHAALPLEQFLYKGRAIPFYGTSSDPAQQKMLDVVQKFQFSERMTSIANTTVRLKSDLGIGFESCGEVNAFFSAQRRAIVICSEFLGMVSKLAANDAHGVAKLPKEQFAKILDGLVWGVYFHELGHALMKINGISITGREEDVADQFAVWFALNFVDLNKTPIIMPTIWLWRELGKRRNIPAMNEGEMRHFLSDEHSLDEQRIYNVACWAFGTNTPAGVAAARFAKLPEQRASRCEDEYATVERGMMTHFKKYFKLKPLSGRW